MPCDNKSLPIYGPGLPDGGSPKGKLAFRVLLSQFSIDFYKILQSLLSSHLAKNFANSSEYFNSLTILTCNTILRINQN